MKLFEKYFRRKKIKDLIKTVNEAVYSERFEMDDLLKNITKNYQKEELFCAYVAIEVATQLTEPITKKDIDNTIHIIDSAENFINDSDKFRHTLDSHKAFAKANWIKKVQFITEGKKAKRKNKYSYEGVIYDVEKAKKGPSSSQEREKFKSLSNDVKGSEQKYNEYKEAARKKQEEDEEKASVAAAEAAIQRIIAEVEEEKKLYGEKSQEQLLKEREEILQNIKDILGKSKNDNS